MKLGVILCSLALLSSALANRAAANSGPAWFVDGYHGGVHGHYPSTFTQFIVESLEQHPDWRLNLEIEPETWDFAQQHTPEPFARFKALAQDQSAEGRIEFVNPAYGQAYFWNIPGESIIQQFERGITKLREHFPAARLTTYCSEEPCFTSALPGILKSFGFEHAVLKNPNTCWGGYTRAFGGELVNWIGPDGAGIVTVPRYGIETLQTDRTWETSANANAPEYIRAAHAAGIQHPVGMCLQDAGWRNGPWLGTGAYQPTHYTTWRNYFTRVATNPPTQDWRFSQEDVQVSLVWGAQVLQRIAQQVRAAENRLTMAEKMAALAGALKGTAWPEQKLDSAWPPLLLAQHHDCWIVPYNGGRSNTWADKVERWTKTTVTLSDEMIRDAAAALTPQNQTDLPTAVRVFNTLATTRRELVTASVPAAWSNLSVRVRDARGHELPGQRVGTNSSAIVFPAAAPALGFETYRLELGEPTTQKIAHASTASNGVVRVETDLYRLEIDPTQGGAIRSWQLKQHGDQELVDARAARKLNEIRGYFFAQKQFFATTDQRATIQVLESGPVRVRLQINSTVAEHPVTQWLTLAAGVPRVDFQVRIDWQNQPRIGSDFSQGKAYRNEQNRKAFYETEFKLLVNFPFQLARPQLAKAAPFDITQSRLTDTRFNSWADIKHDVVLNWVDVFDPERKLGVALLTDHTTSYLHTPEQPLALTLQYAGVGLWGRDYRVQGPTEVRYALLPHAGDAEAAGVWEHGNAWDEPLLVQTHAPTRDPASVSLLSFDRPGWEIPTLRRNATNVIIRIFNPTRTTAERTVTYRAPVAKVELVELDGRVIQPLEIHRHGNHEATFQLALPPFGVRTLRLTP